MLHVLVIREMQIKTRMVYHYRLTRIAKKKKKIATIPNAGRNMEKLDISYIAGRFVKWYSHSGKVALLSFYHREKKKCPYKSL